MANITPTVLGLPSTELAYVAASAGGDVILNNNGRTYLVVKNTSGAPRVVTVDSQHDCDQGFDHDEVATLQDGEEHVLGPWPVSRFQSSVDVTYDDEAGLSIAAFRA